MRFGTLRLAVSLGHPRYVHAFETHLRSILEPPLEPGEVADLTLDVIDDGSTAPTASAARDRPRRGGQPLELTGR